MTLNAVVLPALVVALTAMWEGPARATGEGLDISPSAATAGRGGAGTAAFWTADLDDWANPALLGYLQGMDYGETTTRLVPDLAPDVHFRTYRLAIGGGGIGVNVASTMVDYGVIPLTDYVGNPIGFYRGREIADRTGVGLSLSRLIDAISALRGEATPAIARHADVAVGFTTKDLKLDLAPPSYGGVAMARVRDLGLLLRVNPIPRTDAGHAFIEMAYGYASLNHNNATVTFGDIAYFVVKQHRNGGSIRVGIPIGFGAPRGPVGWIVRGMDPYLTVSIAADHVNHVYPNYEVDAVGAEIDLGGLVTGRLGHVTDRAGDVVGYSYGVGIGLPLAYFAGLRYDFASYPEATGLSSIHRHGIGAWFDLIALARQ